MTMRYFRNSQTGEVSAFDSDYFDNGGAISEPLIEMSDYEVYDFLNPAPTPAQLDQSAKDNISKQLGGVYRPRLEVGLRAIRMAESQEDRLSAELEVRRLDEYAEALISVSSQKDYPIFIEWPDLKDYLSNDVA